MGFISELPLASIFAFFIQISSQPAALSAYGCCTTSFAILLAANSEFVMSTTDKDIVASLSAYCVSFKKTKGLVPNTA
jgi:hypothetical protein